MIPNFRSKLRLSPYPDGVTWYLDTTLVYARRHEVIRVPSNFETDLASVPRAFYSLFPPWGVYGEAAILHDWLYWHQGKSKPDADAIFLEAMTALGVQRWKRTCLYLAVRLFGRSAWDNNALIGSQGYSRIRTRCSPVSPEWNR